MLIIAVKRFKPAVQAPLLSIYLTVFKKEITKIKKITCANYRNYIFKKNKFSRHDSIGHIYIELNYIILAYHYRSD